MTAGVQAKSFKLDASERTTLSKEGQGPRKETGRNFSIVNMVSINQTKRRQAHRSSNKTGKKKESESNLDPETTGKQPRCEGGRRKRWIQKKIKKQQQGRQRNQGEGG